jgi:hypothetical protein
MTGCQWLMNWKEFGRKWAIMYLEVLSWNFPRDIEGNRENFAGIIGVPVSNVISLAKIQTEHPLNTV